MKTLLLLVVSLAAAQAAAPALTSTTTTAAVTLSATDMYIAGATSVVAGSFGYVDKELFRVVSVNPPGTTAALLQITRGLGGKVSGHASGATVYFGTGQQFYQRTPSGTCTTATVEITPWINTKNGTAWECVNSAWQQVQVPDSMITANLPTCNAGNAGRSMVVSDSNTTTWGASITGSSTNKVLALCNGTAWTVLGK